MAQHSSPEKTEGPSYNAQVAERLELIRKQNAAKREENQTALDKIKADMAQTPAGQRALKNMGI